MAETIKEILAEYLGDAGPELLERVNARMAEIRKEASALQLVGEVLEEKCGGGLPGEVPIVVTMKPEQLEPPKRRGPGRKRGPAPPSIGKAKRVERADSDDDKRTAGAKIADYLAEVGEPCSVGGIAAATGIAYGTVFAALKNDRFRKTPSGNYELAQA